jgi:uncharacterized membrane protein affecting hemolysin expression
VIFPLRFKLALLASLLLVAAIGTISLIVLDQSAQALAAEAGKRAVVLAEQLARNAREPLLLEDDLTLSQLLESIAKESEVSVARVLDKDGRVLASSVKDEPELRERMTGKEKIASCAGRKLPSACV